MPQNRHLNSIAIYVRWSTDDQGTGTTFEVQRERCLAYARSQGWSVPDANIFVDGGYSGATLERPALRRLRRDVEQGNVDCVIVASLDRLSRDLRDVVTLVHEEWDGKCSLVAVREGFDVHSEFGRVQFALAAIFSQQERVFIKDRMQAGRLTVMRSGKKVATRPPFGYCATRAGTWVEHPTEGLVVRKVFELVAGGMTVPAVLNVLRNERMTDRNGKELTPRSVYRMLKNPAYLGELKWGASKTVTTPNLGPPPHVLAESLAARQPRFNTKTTKNAEPSIHIRAEAIPQLITHDLFERVNEQLATRTSQGTREFKYPPGHRLLIGIAQCRCGSPLSYAERDRGNRTHSYYLCTWKHGHGIPCPYDAGSIPFEEANALVSTHFLSMFGRSEWNDRVSQELEQSLATCRIRIAALETQIKTMNHRVKSLFTSAREGRFTLRDLAAEQSRLAHERQPLQQDLEAVTAECETIEQRLQVLQMTATVSTQWETLSVANQQELIRRVLREKIVVLRQPGEQTIQFECTWLYNSDPNKGI